MTVPLGPCLLQPLTKQNPVTADMLAASGMARLHLQDRDGALADAQRALELELLNDNAVMLRAWIEVRSDRSSAAIALLSTALARRPSAVAWRQRLARL